MDTDLLCGPLTHQLDIPLGGHASLASAHRAGVREGAGAAALEDCADRNGEGLAFRVDLEFLNHLLDHLLAPDLAGLHHVVDGRLALLLGGITPLEGKFNLLGGRRLRQGHKLALVKAGRGEASRRKAEVVGPTEADHVHGIVAQVAQLIPHVADAEVGSLRVVHQFHVDAAVLANFILLGLELGTAPDDLEARALEDGGQVKVLLDSCVRADLLGEDLDGTHAADSLGELDRGREFALSHVKGELDVKGSNTNSLLIDARVDSLASEGDQGSNTACNAPVNNNLKGSLNMSATRDGLQHVGVVAATEGSNSGPLHLSKDGQAKVRGYHLLIGRQVNNTLPVEGT